MTVKEMIKKLQELEAQGLGDTRVVVYDEYTANEGWDYEEDDLYVTAAVNECCIHTLSTGEKVLQVFMVDEDWDTEE